MKKRLIVAVVFVGICFGLVCPGLAGIYNSKVNYSDKQGAVWYYKSYSPRTRQYKNLQYSNSGAGTWHIPPDKASNPNRSCRIGAAWQAPGKTYDSVRQFKVPKGVTEITIKGFAIVTNNKGRGRSDGTVLTIVRNKKVLFTKYVPPRTQKNPKTGVIFKLNDVRVQSGDSIYFRLNRKNAPASDCTQLNIRIFTNEKIPTITRTKKLNLDKLVLAMILMHHPVNKNCFIGFGDRPLIPPVTDIKAGYRQRYLLAKEHGLNGFGVEVVPRLGENAIKKFGLLFEAARGTGFKIIPSLNASPQTNPRAETHLPFLLRWLEKFGRDKDVFRVNGKIVIFTYNAMSIPLDDWRKIVAGVRNAGYKVFFIADMSNRKIIVGEEGEKRRKLMKPYLQLLDGFGQMSSGHLGGRNRHAAMYYDAVKTINECSSPKIFVSSLSRGYWAPNFNLGYSPEKGTATFRNRWQEALKVKPDWVKIMSWNEYNEQTGIEPSFRSSDVYLEITKYYSYLWKQIDYPVSSTPKLYLSYREELLPGEPLHVEVLSFPSSKPFWVHCVLKNEKGKSVKVFKPKQLSGKGLGIADFNVPADKLKGVKCVTPYISISNSKDSVPVDDMTSSLSIILQRNKEIRLSGLGQSIAERVRQDGRVNRATRHISFQQIAKPEKLFFEIDGHHQGEEYFSSNPKSIKVKVHVKSSGYLKKVALVKNHKDVWYFDKNSSSKLPRRFVIKYSGWGLKCDGNLRLSRGSALFATTDDPMRDITANKNKWTWRLTLGKNPEAGKSYYFEVLADDNDEFVLNSGGKTVKFTLAELRNRPVKIELEKSRERLAEEKRMSRIGISRAFYPASIRVVMIDEEIDACPPSIHVKELKSELTLPQGENLPINCYYLRIETEDGKTFWSRPIFARSSS